MREHTHNCNSIYSINSICRQLLIEIQSFLNVSLLMTVEFTGILDSWKSRGYNEENVPGIQVEKCRRL